MNEQMSKNNWHTKSEQETLKAHASDLELGISEQEVIRRQELYGQNKIPGSRKKSGWKIFFSQFTDFLVLVLIGAAIIASILGEPQDAIAIIAIITLNALLGFVQEYRAERAIDALRALASPQARVRRSGVVLLLPAYELVPGDIVLLEAGNIVPADLRILESMGLKVDESMLTGESVAVEKETQLIPNFEKSQVAIADQKNMAFKGTIVTGGRALGLVVRTGLSTELGKIATLLKEEVEVKTPLQKRLAKFARSLALVVFALCLIIFVVGLLRGEEPVLMFLTALSLAVAGIPEALPAVVTVALALGARAMSKRNALIRKLPAVEALGSVTTVCTDKTGTLTENRMQVQSYFVAGKTFESPPSQALEQKEWKRVIYILALNNDVTMGSKGVFQGEATEVALAQAAQEVGIEKDLIEAQYKRIAEIPFSSERGMMTTLHEYDGGSLVLVKGAPERLLALCKESADVLFFEKIQAQVTQMAAQGFRVLALADRELSGKTKSHTLDELEQDLSFVGLVGLMDPPRENVREAIASCFTAGIRVVMITGDHPLTARAIGERLGLLDTKNFNQTTQCMTGQELSQITDEEFQARCRDVVIYARVEPQQKIRIVKALKSVGEIVAMTGDGVNDAPALKSSDVGVSMGKGGTDVAREASHVILLDDNFSTIVAAIREGRRIYDNIRKFVRFALSGNSGEIWTLFLAPFFGLPTPLLPIHILWVNLVTDGLPGLALALEPEEKRNMQRPPRAPNESIFARGLWQHAVWVGLLTAGVTLGTLAWAFHTGHAHWQSMAFTVLTFTQMGHVLAIRSERESLFSQGLGSNLPLFLTVLFTTLLQLGTLYIPACNIIFKTQPLTLQELVICVVISSCVFIAVEIEKAFLRKP